MKENNTVDKTKQTQKEKFKMKYKINTLMDNPPREETKLSKTLLSFKSDKINFDYHVNIPSHPLFQEYQKTNYETQKSTPAKKGKSTKNKLICCSK